MEKCFKILLSTDYSNSVMNAERYAVQFAEDTDSILIFFHVYELPLSSTPSKPLEFAKTRDAFYTSELKKLEDHRDKLFRSLGIK